MQRKHFLPFISLIIGVIGMNACFAEREHGHGGRGAGGHEAGGSHETSRTINRMHSVKLPHAQTIPTKNTSLVSRQKEPPHPTTDVRGNKINATAARTAPTQHKSLVSDPAVTRSIQSQRSSERTPDHYYWHNNNGWNYVHWYDRGGLDWYGFYAGSAFYWTMFLGNYWWWNDPINARWLYWANGYWWWQGPQGPYVYIDNDYYPYGNGVVTVQRPYTVAYSGTHPEYNKGKTYVSPDKARMVQIFGRDREAFLWDNTVNPPTFLNFLGRDVVTVKFSGGGKTGKPLQILANFKDDDFAVYDENGDSSNAAAASEQAAKGAQAGASSASAPAMPSKAPAVPSTPPPSDVKEPPTPSGESSSD